MSMLLKMHKFLCVFFSFIYFSISRAVPLLVSRLNYLRYHISHSFVKVTKKPIIVARLLLRPCFIIPNNVCVTLFLYS